MKGVAKCKNGVVWGDHGPPKLIGNVTIRQINDTKIKCVKECKYLGVVIDDELKWTSHIEFVLQKLKSLLDTLYKMHYKLPNWCLQNIYFAFVHPYNIIVWSRSVW